MSGKLEQQARELLAAELEADGLSIDSGHVQDGLEVSVYSNTAIRAIQQALSTRPSMDGVEVDKLVEIALHARVPGGSEVWCWLPQKDAWTPSPASRDVIRCALEAALASLPLRSDVGGE